MCHQLLTVCVPRKIRRSVQPGKLQRTFINHKLYFLNGQWPKTGAPCAFLVKNGCTEIPGRPRVLLTISDWLAPIFGRRRPGVPDPLYFAQLPSVFGHIMFPTTRWATRTDQLGPQEHLREKIDPYDVEISKQPTITPARHNTRTTYTNQMSAHRGIYSSSQVVVRSVVENCSTNRALPSSSKFGCSEPRYSRQCCTAESREARTRTTTPRCAEPTTAS